MREALKGSGGDDIWVTHRFEAPLRTLRRQSYGNARVHVVVNMAVIAGGFATSGIAVAAGKGGEHGLSWVVFAIGLLVALAGGVSQIFRPGQRSTGRALLAAEMLDEGWALYDRHGEYKQDMKAADLFVLFDRRIASIRDRAFRLSVLEDQPTSGRKR